jgi:hypothetical protein
MILKTIFTSTLDWSLSLLVGWVSYHLLMSFEAPEWVVITVVAVNAVSTFTAVKHN